MLEPGKSYKVKVELEPGRFGYGRATVLERSGGRTYVRLRTAKDLNFVLPTGSRLWFISNSPTSTNQGMWATSVTGTKLFQGKTALECGPLKFESLAQRRKSQRIPLSCPVRLVGKQLSYPVRSRNISKSGIGLEAFSQYIDEFPVGENVEIVVSTPVGAIPLKCQVIRTEYNWLSNRSIIGLQFVAMSQAAVELLENLHSNITALDDESSRRKASTSLAGNIRTTRDNLRLTKSGTETGLENLQEDDEAEPDDF